MKQYINQALFAIFIGTISSCNHESIEDHVTDRSFDFCTQISHDASASQYRLTLILTKASEINEKYSIGFEIDGNTALIPYTVDGKPLDSTIERDYKEGDSETFILPEMDMDEHIIRVRMSTDSYSISRETKIDITNPPFVVHAETDIDAMGRTSVILSMDKGVPRELLLDITLDGSTDVCRNKTIDFSKESIIREYLPLLYPGEHHVSVTIHDDVISMSQTLEFIEPVRFNQINSTISENDEGDIIMTVTDNTYAVKLTAQSRLTVTGLCRWWDNGPVIYNDPPSEAVYHKSDTLSLCSSSIVSFYGDCQKVLARKASLTTELESNHRSSAIWKKDWDNTSEGGWLYHVVGYTEEHYKLTSEIIQVDIGADMPEGMTLSITSQINNLFINGTAVPRGKILRIGSTQSN